MKTKNKIDIFAWLVEINRQFFDENCLFNDFLCFCDNALLLCQFSVPFCLRLAKVLMTK